MADPPDPPDPPDVPPTVPPDVLLDDFRALNEPARRRAVERRGGYFVVEGLFAIEALLDSPYRIRCVLAAER
ncbi:MAG TPA: hypothetical protein VFI47_01355, partial [Acidimicrobiales bacterium]|nr:hypothetical protein [Acidimicrobiales bacterium]